jgi:hypothetical protein
MSDKHFVWNRSKHMKLYTLALVVVLGMFGVSAEAQTCGVLCDERFLESASEAEVKAEISKADVNARSVIFGWTALIYAAWHGTAESVKVLLDAGADASHKDTFGKTAWDHAKKNEALKGTDAYWMLRDARYK